ncbi:DUF1330 domain-containing protein [Ruegeria meonggei]|uniref:DUF1330 domain-containing protein n=1 Tax=Ruegeria meonggei TaxID=1446476 RepID=A0A1X6YWU8_9RHOB|nr:DUF1330 domain-containing protein [Ruegeria meonggei]SLN33662.1 hypothetical protein RUM8411_01452 [Ruegeria meonggei]
MTAFVIFQEDIHDPIAFETYKNMSPASIKKYGGQFVVRGGQIDVLEGDFAHERVVVIAFPDRSAAHGWYNSVDYAEAKDLRKSISSGAAIVVATLS